MIGVYDFIREREKEFSFKNVSREELVVGIDETLAVVLILDEMNIETFKNKYPINVFNKEMTNEFFFIHLTTHLNYHLGQINYLRRFLIN